LARLKTVAKTWYRSGTIRDTELNEFLVNKVFISEVFVRMVNIVVNRVGCEPLLALVGKLLVKGKVDNIIVLLVLIFKLNLMLFD
jgi:hypothetical protein